VQGHLTDDQICDVLTSPNYAMANRTILNCLIQKVKCMDDMVEFCDLLEKITMVHLNPDSLVKVISDLRISKQKIVFTYKITAKGMAQVPNS